MVAAVRLFTRIAGYQFLINAIESLIDKNNIRPINTVIKLDHELFNSVSTHFLFKKLKTKYANREWNLTESLVTYLKVNKHFLSSEDQIEFNKLMFRVKYLKPLIKLLR